MPPTVAAWASSAETPGSGKSFPVMSRHPRPRACVARRAASIYSRAPAENRRIQSVDPASSRPCQTIGPAIGVSVGVRVMGLQG